ncbi:TPA: 50S ribosomal protein L22 [Candidatus Saccharibacteria bacterium]|nr:50S ribosomal protein L22 [Candidatus Saccharibacteria bacterium]HIO87395.1 50S ribosomal protein L22 [Candidatus Saccharibacteria bacterium]
MSVIAKANGVRMSPRKVHEVISLVRGRTVADALVILEHVPRRAAEPVAKLINSAVANAVHNNKMKKNDLFIESIQVGHGPALKRFRAAAMGRAKPYKRRSSNISVALSSITENPQTSDKPAESNTTKPAAKKTATKKATATKKPAAKKTTTKAKKETK